MERALRLFAIAIVIMALVDPALTSARPSSRVIAIVGDADRAGDPSMLERVEALLAGRFLPVRGAFPGADATVVAADRGMPLHLAETAGPLVAIARRGGHPHVAITAVDAPTTSAVDARIAVDVSSAVRGGRGDTLQVELHVGGTVVDATRSAVGADSAWVRSRLEFVPANPGGQAYRVSASLLRGREVRATDSSASMLLDARADRRNVLFYDPRVSWMSTFVRRAVEADARFEVTSRIVTARNVSTGTGRPPADLARPASIAGFDVIVVGAPHAISRQDVAGLERFLRDRGGVVVLLLDAPLDDRFDRLVGPARWRTVTTSPAVPVHFSNDSVALRLTEWMIPSQLPPGADTVASGLRGTTREPVVVQMPVGAGRLVVSGAVDAWRFRDPDTSGFGRTWPALLAAGAAASLPAIEVNLSRAVAATDDDVSVAVSLRHVMLASGAESRADIAAWVDAGGTRHPVTLHPAAPVGTFTGRFRAPRHEGAYHLMVVSRRPGESSADTGSAAGEVLSSPTAVAAGDDERRATWLRVHGARMVPEERLGTLPSVLDRLVAPSTQRSTWHPMRSPFWILPLVAALGAEWWLRRRRGRA